jgi:hypothetical protein
MLNEGNQIHNFIVSVKTLGIPFYYGSVSGSGSGTVINYGSGSASQKVTVPVPQRCLKVTKDYGIDPHPDPLVRGMDPRIRICTKLSRIRNTGEY